MKKIYSFLFAAIGSVAFAQVSDSFSGNGLLNENGWTTHSGTAGQLTILPGSLTYTGLNSTGGKTAIVSGNNEDVNLPSANALTGNVFYSGVINVLNTTGLHPNDATGDYFLMTSATVGTTVTALSARIYIKSGSVENTFNLGVLNNSGGTATPSYVPTDFAVNVPLFVAVKNDLSTNTASIYINPAIGGTEPVPSATNATGSTAAPAQIVGLAIRQGGNANTGTGNVEIDELRLGSTWAYVTSANLRVAQNAIEGLKMYPNPVSGNTLYITSTTNEEKSIAIYDVLGKQVLSANVSDQALNVSSLKNGVYIVKITEAGKTATRKLIVK